MRTRNGGRTVAVILASLLWIATTRHMDAQPAAAQQVSNRAAATAAGLDRQDANDRDPASLAAIAGFVLDDQAQPIAGAEVTVLGPDRVTTTDARGAFLVEALEPQRVIVVIRHSGYQRGMLPLQLRRGHTTSLTVALPPSMPADTVVIEGPAGLPPVALQEFERRRQLGGGIYITAQDIAEMQPGGLLAIFRRATGLRVAQREGVPMLLAAHRTRLDPRTMRQAPCPVRVAVNGNYLAAGVPVNFIDPGEVYGIEIYQHESEAPRHLLPLTGRAECGVVLIWTNP